MSKVNVPELAITDQNLQEYLAKGIKRTEEFLEIESASPFNPLTEISQHLLLAGGKRIRPVLVFLSGQFGKPDIDRLAKVAAAIEFIHVATLYHDDVMDEATMRRGVESANAKFGNTNAILAGDFLFSRASAIAAELGPHVVTTLADTLSVLCEGQIREARGAGNSDPIKHYLEVLKQKTGSLIETSASLGAYVAGADDIVSAALTNYAKNIGLAFQISDDILDLKGDSSKSGKMIGKDLVEGIHTLPVLSALSVDKTSSLKDLLVKVRNNPAAIEETINKVAELGGFDVATLHLESLIDQAMSSLDLVPQGAAKDALVQFAEWLTKRNS
jgi:heptaprenyl diphosphate synthase